MTTGEAAAESFGSLVNQLRTNSARGVASRVAIFDRDLPTLSGALAPIATAEEIVGVTRAYRGELTRDEIQTIASTLRRIYNELPPDERDTFCEALETSAPNAWSAALHELADTSDLARSPKSADELARLLPSGGYDRHDPYVTTDRHARDSARDVLRVWAKFTREDEARINARAGGLESPTTGGALRRR